VLENDKLRVVFAEDGAIVSALDKDYRREVIAEAANRLVTYHDEGDAWDFAPDYRYGPVQRCPLQSAERLVDGPRAIIRHQYRMGTSTIDQDIVLTSGSRRLEFHTRVDWQEDHTMLRTSFPVLVRASEATCDIQFGSVKRPTHRNTGWDMARDEVCAHKWVDLSQGDYGVALLNDSKYGHCMRDNVIDLNLLRSPTTPDPTADRGFHEFAYALLSHPGDYVEGGVVRAAYEFNVPLRLVDVKPTSDGHLPRELSLFAVDAGNVMIETVKRAEDSAEVIVRLYEWAGKTTHSRLRSGLEVDRAWMSDIMEHTVDEIPVSEACLDVSLAPFEILTLKLSIGAPPR
jgi:alpha-mannosidase